MIYTSNSSTLSLSQFLFREGCRLRHLIVTTYTVDCETLLALSSAVYKALSAKGSSSIPVEEAGTNLVDVCLEFPEIMTCAAHHIRLYTQYAPDRASQPRALCENAMSLFAVCGKVMHQPHSFHPKLLLAVFERNGKLEFHLQVGSKNLTVSNALDLSVCLESRQPSLIDDSCNGSQLAGFFQANQIPLPEGVLEALRQTNFQIMGGNTKELTISDIVFAYNSQDQALSDILQKDIQHRPPIAPVHVFSPFLHADSHGTFWGDTLGKDVIYHTNLTKTILKQLQERPFPNLYVAKADQQFYHGKLIMWPVASQETAPKGSNDAEYDDAFRIWVGSANATQNGMHRNSELMVGILMKVHHSSVARANRYPNYFSSPPPFFHTLQAHLGRLLSYKAICFSPSASLSSLSEENCFPEDQSPLLRRLLQNISLRAYLDHATPMLEIKIKQENPSGIPYTVRVQLGDQNPRDLPYEKKVYHFVEKAFPANGVYEITLLDNCNNPVVNTYIQAEKGEDVIFPPSTSLLTLLREMTARQTIPNCAAQGFSRPDDDLYQRLRAFLCSYDWDGRADHPAFQRLEKRLERVVQCLHSQTGTFYMAAPEKEEFEELCVAVCSMKGKDPYKEEAGE